ncbi:MAG: hypothetical protein ATN35_00030 [Epulopiscium sp. Nele67-Bin004]|nr:MAG: hypothetical protein ATN35_00030 [Epulopiscium sp. Nele67-Bin004]
MSAVRFTTTKNINIPSWFIRDFVPMAHGSYIKVYLLLISAYQENIETDLKDLAQTLDMLYSEVITILKYWDSKGVIKFQMFGDEISEIAFATTATFGVSQEITAPIIQATQQQAPQVVSTPEPVEDTTTIIQNRPAYSQQELNIYRRNNSSITQLFNTAEECLGRLLSPTDQQILFGLYDWLHMPIDLIVYLLEYCTKDLDKRHTRYIEKVALSWKDKGIVDVERAKLEIVADHRYYEILKRAGISTQNISPAQREYLERWVTTYRMEIILNACDRATIQADRPNLNYIDKILTNWYDQGVRIVEDIEAVDKKPRAVATTKPQPMQKTARYNNMPSHNWDYNKIAMLEQEYNERIRQGG